MKTEILQKWVVFDPLCGDMAAKMTKKKPLDAYQAVSVLANDPNFNTNAPPFRVRGCIAVIGGAFLLKGVQTMRGGAFTKTDHRSALFRPRQSAPPALAFHLRKGSAPT